MISELRKRTSDQLADRLHDAVHSEQIGAPTVAARWRLVVDTLDLLIDAAIADERAKTTITATVDAQGATEEVRRLIAEAARVHDDAARRHMTELQADAWREIFELVAKLDPEHFRGSGRPIDFVRQWIEKRHGERGIVESYRQRSDAWGAVVEALCDVGGGWHVKGRTGAESAVAWIREHARPVAVAPTETSFAAPVSGTLEAVIVDGKRYAIRDGRAVLDSGDARELVSDAGPYCPETREPCGRMCQTICNVRAERRAASRPHTFERRDSLHYPCRDCGADMLEPHTAECPGPPGYDANGSPVP